MTDNNNVEQAAFTAHEAAAYLGVEARWLDDAPIPRSDIRKRGSAKPLWRWRRVDLDAFLEARVVKPGHVSPWGQG